MEKKLGFIPEAESIIKEALEDIVKSGFVPGCGVMVGYKGEKVFEIYTGIADKETGKAVSADTRYRMYSMTKVFTVSAVMQLWDRGLIRLNDPLSKFIPEYANPVVAVCGMSGNYQLVPAEREIMIYDLLTMTSGIPYDAEGPTGKVIADITARWAADKKEGKDWDTIRVARELAKAPLLFQPGKYFQYGLSHDILGAVIEVITGKNLYEYLKENFFMPLGMDSATFEIDESNRDLMAEVYGASGKPVKGMGSPIIDTSLGYDKPRFFSGGAGLVCTMGDYFKFVRMLAHNGTVDGKRYLSRKAIEMISTPQLNARQMQTYNAADESPNNIYRGYNYGFGVRVCTEPGISANANSKGEYGWAGALGTWMFVDPEEDIFLVYVHQRTPVDHEAYMPQVCRAVYSALK